MDRRNIVVVGASAGGSDAIRRLVASLPPDIDITLLIVWHMAPGVMGMLPRLLNKEHTLLASHALDSEPLEPRRIYVAPPDRHLIVERGRVRVTKGPKENRFRPAVDPLFRSAALAYGPRVIGIVLSGALDDGSAGLWAIKNFGGTAIVQDPTEAEVPSMPENAMNAVHVDYKLKIDEMGAVLHKLSQEEVVPKLPTAGETSVMLTQEVEIAMGMINSNYDLLQYGKASRIACPDCHGVLSSFDEAGHIRFRCHTGHAYSGNTLLDSIGLEIEEYLWSAVRASQEITMLLNNLGDHFAESNNPKLASHYFNKARDSEQRLSAILAALHFHESMPPDVAIENAKAQK